jgi:hypothetical protein
MIYNNDEYAPGPPVVVSSFYPSPDGKSSVRFYEIKNSNPNLQKIRRDELDEPRFENSASRVFSSIRNLFVTPKEKLYKPPAQFDRTRQHQLQNHLNVQKNISLHTKQNGNVVTVTSLDLSNNNSNNPALKEFVTRKAALDRVAASNGNNLAKSPTPMLRHPQSHQVGPNGAIGNLVNANPIIPPNHQYKQNSLRTPSVNAVFPVAVDLNSVPPPLLPHPVVVPRLVAMPPQQQMVIRR